MPPFETLLDRCTHRNFQGPYEADGRDAAAATVCRENDHVVLVAGALSIRQQ